jgi:hypothetical protein
LIPPAQKDDLRRTLSAGAMEHVRDSYACARTAPSMSEVETPVFA